MSNTALVFSCAHVKPKQKLDRFKWLGNLIYDVRPNYVVDLGDFSDMASLSSHDTRYPKTVVNQSYQQDIEATHEAQFLLREQFVRRKRKKPDWFGFEGNHENRIRKALAYDPRLEGKKYGVSFEHLRTNYWYDEYHSYENSAPAIREYDGVYYSHFISSGNYGTALSGIHHGYALTQKMAASCTVGHSHKRSYYVKQEAKPNPIHGLVVGCYKGSDEEWAGQSNQEWSRGVCIKRNLSNGNYDLQWISIEALEKDYC